MKAKKKKDRGIQKEISELATDTQNDLSPVTEKKDGSLVAYDPFQIYLWEIRR